MLLAALAPLALFMILDAAFPLPSPDREKDFAVMVTAENGAPLRAFPDPDGVWRYPVVPEQVSPRYLEALINYEDQMFYHHPGVNPWSLLRAAYLYAKEGRPVSGGSTLTMQTARIIDMHKRTIPGKMKQIFRALQLEWHFSKEEILTIYLNYAPFGGPVEGVQAASYAYLGKSARELSHAEAALLAVLPQAPSRFRPDRHPETAARARDKILDRMADFGVWDETTVKEAKIEKVMPRFDPKPMTAPLLARRTKPYATPRKPVRTTIDANIQETVEDLVQGYMNGTPEHTSAAVLVVENKTMAARAYVGSADFTDESRFGHVDMITALRSPGSTLKPFLYGFALEEGLIHSESLLIDAPVTFSGYRPGNFSQGFSGPVSAADALRRSLNIPAVDLLDRLGSRIFDVKLRQGGLNLRYPSGGGPNLSMVLGGVGASLEDLVGAYTAFARNGLSGRVRLLADETIQNRRMMSPGAAYIIRKILQEHKRTDLPGGALNLAGSRDIAWKTGTSYGYRDAWAIGVTDDFTIGVWIGRPDGTPTPGQYGRATAAPLLFLVVDSLPRKPGRPAPVPDSVSKVQICWPLGVQPQSADDPLCHQKRTAWILNGVIPPTLPDRSDKLWKPNPVAILVNPRTGLRVEADCPVPNPVKKIIARWPRNAQPWLTPDLRKRSAIPGLDSACKNPVAAAPANIEIIDIQDGDVFRPQGAETVLPMVALQAMGGEGSLFWLLDGELIAQADIGEIRYYRFKHPGAYRLTVIDLAGNHASAEIKVLAGNPGS